MTLIATALLAAAVLFRSPPSYRMPVGIIVSVAALMLVVRSLSTGKIVWTLPFLGVIGIFTPFRSSPFSHTLISIFDVATLALFVASSMMLRKSTGPVVPSSPRGKL